MSRRDDIQFSSPDAEAAKSLLPVARQIFTDTFAHLFERQAFQAFCDEAYAKDGPMARDFHDPKVFWQVANYLGAPIGYAKLTPVRAPASAATPGAMELQQIHVLAKWQGSGVADELMRWAVSTARRELAPELYLTVFDHYERAKRFYSRATGLRKWGVARSHWGTRRTTTGYGARILPRMRPDHSANRTLAARARQESIQPLHLQDIAMTRSNATSRFKATLLRPLHPGDGDTWAFLVLPKAASDKLPRRGRTTVEGTLNGQPFQATLEPDGQLSHWLKVDADLHAAIGACIGDVVTLEISPVDPEPEPRLPPDLADALAASPDAKATWDTTTTIARVDWIHWIDSAKQRKTRERRIHNACDMLASGKDRVCCFDQSGFYSKSLGAPKPA